MASTQSTFDFDAEPPPPPTKIICLNWERESYMCPVCLALFDLDDAEQLGASSIQNVFCPDCAQELRL